MSKLNTLYKIVNTMKEENYNLDQIKVEFIKDNQSEVIYEGEHKHGAGHSQGRCGHHHRGMNREEMMKKHGQFDKEKFKGRKLNRIGMALKALDKLEIEDSGEGKILSLDIDPADFPKDIKDHMKKRKEMMKNHMQEHGEEFKNHPKFEKMQEFKNKAKSYGLSPETTDLENGNVKAFVDADNRVTKIIFTLNLKTEEDLVTIQATKTA